MIADGEGAANFSPCPAGLPGLGTRDRLLALGIGDAFAAERRIALVIGNSKFKDSNISLTNPGSDAEDLAAVLRELKFTVILTRDATTREMDTALTKFSEDAKGEDAALFYYAGHALQY